MSIKVFQCTSSDGGPGAKLSNLYPYEFYFDDLKCASMEGFLQGLKCQDISEARALHALSGKEAWKAGQSFTKRWQETQTLYWAGQPFNRQSTGYQNLIEKAYDCLSLNRDFANNLIQTEYSELRHDIGKHDSHLTVLTRSEFMCNLYRVRSNLTHQRLFGTD